MDKIWYRNPSKSGIIDRCGGDEKTEMTTQNQQKSNAKTKENSNWVFPPSYSSHILQLCKVSPV